MAKQKKLRAVDDFGFDSGLEIPSFDYPQSNPKNDRKPVTKASRNFAKGVATGVWQSATSESFIHRTLKQALPEGYGTALDVADQTGRNLKSLYDSSAKEVKPLLNDMKRATGKLLPAVGKVLPKKVQDRIKAWSETYDSGSSGISESQMRDQTLQATLGDIFKYQAETGAQQRAEDKAESNIHRQIENNRSNMQLAGLNTMSIALQRLADYQDKVTVNYQRKSLELQYRQYFVAMDSLTHQKDASVKTKELLEEIKKNTGLPDVLKIQVSKDFPTLIRNKFFGNVGSMLLGNRSQFMQNLTNNIQTSVMENVKRFVGGARTGISGLEFGMDMGNMMGDEGPGMANMAGGMVGSAVGGHFADKAGRRAAGWVKQKLDGSKYGPAVRRAGNKLNYAAGNIPQHAAEFADSDKYDDLPFGLGGLVRFLKGNIKLTNETKTGLDQDNLRNLQEPAVFNGIARKSLTEIIPGYLARIHQELQIIRTGNPKTDMTTFDITSGRFKSRQDTGRAIHSALFKKSDKDYVKRGSDYMLDEIERGTGKKLTPELRKAISETLMEDNLKNRLGSPERLGNNGTYFGRKHYEQGNEMAQTFRDYFKDDHEGQKKMRFQEIMNRVGSGMADGRSDIQGLLNMGYGDHLSEMGLLNKAGTGINMDKYQDYYLNGEYNPNAAHADGNVRGFTAQPSNRPDVAFGKGRGVGKRVKPNQRPAAGNRTTNNKNDKRRYDTQIHNHISTVINHVMSEVADHLNVTNLTPGVGGIHASSAQPNVADTPKTRFDAAERAKTYRRAKKKQQGQARHPLDTSIKPTMAGQREAMPNDQGGIIRAIETNSAKPVSEKILEALLKIDKRVADGLDVRHYHSRFGDKSGKPILDNIAGKAKGLYQMTLGDLVSGGISGLKSAAGFARTLPGRAIDAGKWAAGKAVGPLARLTGLASKGKEKALAFASKFDDIYIPGKAGPALLAWKLRAGHYRDKTTGDVIKSYKDIKGDLIDIFDNNNVVLQAKDILHAYTLSKAKETLLTSLGATAKFALKTLGSMQAGVFSALPKMLDMGKRALDIGIHFLDQPMDVYVKGKSEPMLLARMMKAGAYVSKMTGKPVNRPGEIDGPVMDISDKANPKEAISREDLSGGIFDWQGKPIRTPFQKVWDTVAKPFKMIKGAVDTGLGFAKALISKPIQAIGQFFTNWFAADGIVFSGSKTIVQRLTEIRDLLVDRLPKPKKILKNSWQDKEKKLEAAAKAGKGTSAGPDKGILSKLGGLGSGLTGLLSIFKKKEAGDEKDAAEKKKQGGFFGTVKSLGKSAVEGLAGTVAGKAAGKVGGRALSKVAEKTGSSFLKRMAARFGVEGAAEAGAAGLEGAAAAAGGEAAVAGGAALASGAAGTAAGLGAGIAAEVGLGAAGASMLGALATGLGVAGAAVAAIAASPVVIVAGVIALAAGAAYAIHRGVDHLLAKKLEPLSTVRMAQYGCKADDFDHIQAMFQFEKNVMKHVIYDAKGKASFDDKKLSAADAFDPFGVDKSNQRDLKNWFSWYQLRFKPVFLSNMTALHAVNGKVGLDNVDKSLSKEEKLKFLKAAGSTSGPYGYMTTPFHQSSFLFMHFGGKLTASYSEVRDAVALAEKAISKEADSTKDKKPEAAKTGAGVAAAAAAKGAGAADAKNDKKPESTLSKISGFLGKALSLTGIGALMSGAAWLASFFKPKGKDDVDTTGTSSGSTGIGMTIAAALGITSSKTSGPLATMRYAQYGFLATQKDFIKAVVGLENTLMKAIVAKDGKIELDPKKIKVGEITQGFDIAMQDSAQVANYQAWFQKRFKPVFLAHLTALRAANPNCALGEVDTQLKKEEKQKYYEGAKLTSGPYSLMAAPFWTISKLSAGPTEVSDATALAGAAIAGTVSKPNTFAKVATSVLAAATGSTSANAATTKPKGDGGKGWTDILADKAKGAMDSVKTWAGGVLDKGKTVVASGVAAAGKAASAVGSAASTVYNQAKTAVGAGTKNVVTGVGDTMKGFGASLGTAYKAVTGNAKTVKDAALAALAKAGITNPTEQAMFMAQMDHESGGFKSLSENLKYSAATLMKLFGKKLSGGMQQAQQIASQGAQAVANFIYGHRMGNTADDDGFKYRGRGIIQLTGKDNYTKFGKMIGVDLIGNPDLASDPKVAAQIAVAYWKTRVSSSAAQAGDVATVTKEINGGEIGLAERQSKFQQYLQQAKAGKLTPDGKGDDTTTAAAGGTGTSAAGGATGTGVGTVAKAPTSSPGGSPVGSSPTLASLSSNSATGASGPSTATPGTPTGKGATGGVIQTAASSATPGAATKIPTVPVATPSTPAPDSMPNQFGFGAQSMKPMGQAQGPAGSKQILAVQQAQHEDKMAAMGSVGDVLNQSLTVQTDSRDTLKSILTMLQGMQGAKDGSGAQTDSQAPTPAANGPKSANRGQQQPMVKSPVSMSKMV